GGVGSFCGEVRGERLVRRSGSCEVYRWCGCRHGIYGRSGYRDEVQLRICQFRDLPVLLALAEKDAVAATQNQPRRNLIAKPKTWGDVPVMPLHNCGGIAVLIGQTYDSKPSQVGRRERIENPTDVPGVHRLRE